MREIQGRYTEAIINTNVVDNKTLNTFIEMCNQSIFKNSKINVLPNCYMKDGYPSGFTMTYKDKICPEMVGKDIGCGVLVAKLPKEVINISFDDLKKYIYEYIFCDSCTTFGFQKEFIDEVMMLSENFKISLNEKVSHILIKRLFNSNKSSHFIEIDKDDEENFYLIIHTGPGAFGSFVSRYYSIKADAKYDKQLMAIQTQTEKTINEFMLNGREKDCDIAERQVRLCNIDFLTLNRKYHFLSGTEKMNFLNDANICVQIGLVYRKYIMKMILSFICKRLNISMITDAILFNNPHNYIDVKNKIIYNNAYLSNNGLFISSINMRDGNILGEMSNTVIPSGTGRMISRKLSRKMVPYEIFEKSIQGIYIDKLPIDLITEAPMIYKPYEEIISNSNIDMSKIKFLEPLFVIK